MIFVDSNVPIYLVGADHPNKTRSRLLLERATSRVMTFDRGFDGIPGIVRLA